METIEHTIRTRGYELDWQSLIPPTVFLRYMEQLRWESAARGSFDLSKLLSAGYLLVVVGQKLSLQQQVGLGVDLTGTHQICLAGRTSITIQNNFTLAGERVATGLATAVFLEPGGAPAPLTPDLRALAVGEEPPQVAPRLEGPSPESAWRWPVQVRPSDLDLYKHANQAIYLAYIEDARAMAVKEDALPRSAGGRLERVAIDYKQQTFMGDKLEVKVWEIEAEALGFEILRGDEIVTRARVEL